MKSILLVCSAGMSTNLLVSHMEEAAQERGEEVKIFALPVSQCEEVIDQVDVILLSPQARFQKASIEAIVSKRAGGAIPIELVNMKDYANMNGKAVYEFAMSLL